MEVFKGIKVPSIETMSSEDGYENLEAAKRALQNQASLLEQSFSSFTEECSAVLDTAEGLIGEVNSGDPSEINESLDSLVSISQAIGSKRVDAEAFLSLYQMLGHCPKQKNLTDKDRVRHTEMAVLIPKLLVNKLSNMEKWLERKISVSQSMLKHESTRYVGKT